MAQRCQQAMRKRTFLALLLLAVVAAAVGETTAAFLSSSAASNYHRHAAVQSTGSTRLLPIQHGFPKPSSTSSLGFTMTRQLPTIQIHHGQQCSATRTTSFKNGSNNFSNLLRINPLSSTQSKRSTTTTLFMSNKNNNNQDNIVTSLFRSLFKGITLPFPSLRRLVLDLKKKKNIQVGLGLRESVAAVALYLTIGVASYHYVLEPTWTLVDAMYFTVTCFTTVGYGDIVPTTIASKIFTCLFGLVGISFLGAAIATVSSRVVESEIDAIDAAKKVTRRNFRNLFDGMPDVLHTFKKSSTKDQDAHFEQVKIKAQNDNSDVDKNDSGGGVWRATLSAMPSLFMVFLGGSLVHALNADARPWWDAIYYSVITASTIGLGDISPTTRNARIASIVYIPLAVAAAGDLLSGVATAMIERRQQQVYKEQMEKQLTIKKLKDMDTNGDGKVSRSEYIKFMLLEMDMVDEEELNELDQQFDRLDKDQSGYLDKNDLALMAKYRGVEVEQ